MRQREKALWVALFVLIIVSGGLLVYLGAVVLARLMLFLTYYPPDPELVARVQSW
jgi:hypothetical protein